MGSQPHGWAWKAFVPGRLADTCITRRKVGGKYGPHTATALETWCRPPERADESELSGPVVLLGPFLPLLTTDASSVIQSKFFIQAGVG